MTSELPIFEPTPDAHRAASPQGSEAGQTGTGEVDGERIGGRGWRGKGRMIEGKERRGEWDVGGRTIGEGEGRGGGWRSGDRGRGGGGDKG